MLSLKKIHIKNWKNFGNVDLELGSRMFLVGANASGKSNFLDVFRFLKDLANDGLEKALNARGGIKKVRNLNARKPSYVEIKICLEEENGGEEEQWEYMLQFNNRGGTAERPYVCVFKESVILNGKSILLRAIDDENEDATSIRYTHLEQPAMNTQFRTLFEAFRGITYVNIIPQLIRESESFIPSNAMEDYYGRNLLEHISETNVRNRNSRLKKISGILKIAVPKFSDLEYVLDEKGRPHLRVRYEHFRPSGAFQQEDQFSDGTLRLLGIIWAILDGDGLLLLEEPELYLHSAIVEQLPMFIAKAQRSKKGKTRQVFISSHSFDLLNNDSISAEEIAVLQLGDENTEIVAADKIEEINEKIEAGFTPADAVIPHVVPKGIIDGQLSLFDL